MNNIEKLKNLLEKTNCTEHELQNFYIRMVGMGATLGELQEINYKIQSVKKEAQNNS